MGYGIWDMGYGIWDMKYKYETHLKTFRQYYVSMTPRSATTTTLCSIFHLNTGFQFLYLPLIRLQYLCFYYRLKYFQRAHKISLARNIQL